MPSLHAMTPHDDPPAAPGLSDAEKRRQSPGIDIGLTDEQLDVILGGGFDYIWHPIIDWRLRRACAIGYAAASGPPRESAPQVPREQAARILALFAGYASMCWEPKPTGIFASERCSQAVDDALDKLYPVPAAAVAEPMRHLTKDEQASMKAALFRSAKRIDTPEPAPAATGVSHCHEPPTPDDGRSRSDAGLLRDLEDKYEPFPPRREAAARLRELLADQKTMTARLATLLANEASYESRLRELLAQHEADAARIAEAEAALGIFLNSAGQLAARAIPYLENLPADDYEKGELLQAAKNFVARKNGQVENAKAIKWMDEWKARAETAEAARDQAESRLALAAKVIEAAKRVRAGLKVGHSWEEIDTFDAALAEFQRRYAGETAKKSPID